jgi:hypothetical protein
MSHVDARLEWMFLPGTGKKSAGKSISVLRLFSGGFRDHRETYSASGIRDLFPRHPSHRNAQIFCRI